MTPPNADPFERRLAPELFDRRFDELFELGRSQLPRLAPEWTDHNRHDPGITLMELLAWVAEAQLYSLARMRRDERAAYAALLGVEPHGPQPAAGLIWPLRPAPGAASFGQSFVIGQDAAVHPAGSEEVPTFHPTHRVLWIAGRIRSLQTRLANGERRDLTRVNERGGPAFAPFGDSADPHDVLALEFECASDSGLFPPRRADADGARLVIGVRADEAGGGAVEPAVAQAACAAPLEVTLVAGTERFPLTLVADATQGFMRTGECVLDVSAVQGSPTAFTLEFRSPAGFARAPRVLAIEPNVLPIEQGERVEREAHTSGALLLPDQITKLPLPDQGIELYKPGLRFGGQVEPLKVEIDDPAPSALWEPQASLSDCGPGERVYQLDAASGRISFGNGVNGGIPAPDAQIFVSYSVCDGDAGNVARNRQWTVRGVSGVYGENRDPVGGGSDASGAIEQRRDARRRALEAHALVTAADITAAALELPALEVARAWVSPPRENALEKGTVTLVALRQRPAGVEPAQPPETPRWLAAIRRRLAPRIPLGTRLAVIGPAYAQFSIQAKLEAEASLDPKSVQDAAWALLRNRLALVKAQDGTPPREFGVKVTPRDLAAWLLKTPGVRRVIELRVSIASGKPADSDWVPQRGLPTLDAAHSSLTVLRAASAGAV